MSDRVAGPSEATSAYVALFRVTNTTPGVLRVYRNLRSFGLNRYDSNLVVAGICMASGQGQAEIRRVRRTSAEHPA
jgi:hypothetical protein